MIYELCMFRTESPFGTWNFEATGTPKTASYLNPEAEAKRSAFFLQSASFDGMYCHLDGDENEAVEAASGLVQSPHSTDTR